MPTLVELSAFDPNWTSDFSAAEVLLRMRLAKYVVSIEHIGSTAVPGLTAKPIIDIDITVSSLDDVPGATLELIKIGFEPRGNRYDDDVWAFFWKRRTPQIRVYLCPPSNRTHERRILFRDYLRQHDEAAAAYVVLKRRLSDQFPYDGDRYTVTDVSDPHCLEPEPLLSGIAPICSVRGKRFRFRMSRRNQFNGICHDILGTFVSRYNDHDGYWSLGQYISLLERLGESQLQLRLRDATEAPDNRIIAATEKYYRGAVLRMMEANSMPQVWFANATIKVSIVAPAKVACEIEIVSDLGRTYRSERTITVRPHDPVIELRRTGRFGPSNQKGH